MLSLIGQPFTVIPGVMILRSMFFIYKKYLECFIRTDIFNYKNAEECCTKQIQYVSI